MFFCHFSLLLFFRRNEGRGWVNYEDHDRVTFERIFRLGMQFGEIGEVSSVEEMNDEKEEKKKKK